jgi:hypothetical protein
MVMVLLGGGSFDMDRVGVGGLEEVGDLFISPAGSVHYCFV